jgi:hypothetical protein
MTRVYIAVWTACCRTRRSSNRISSSVMESILAFASAADLKLVTFDPALKSRSDNVVVL